MKIFSIALAFLTFCHPAFSEDKEITKVIKDSDCNKDSDCILVTDVRQACYHFDSSAEILCPAFHKEIVKTLKDINCSLSLGCKETKKARCNAGRCVASEH